MEKKDVELVLSNIDINGLKCSWRLLLKFITGYSILYVSNGYYLVFTSATTSHNLIKKE